MVVAAGRYMTRLAEACLVVALATCVTANPARAVTPVFVDLVDPTCGGFGTPANCFATIQAAVDNAGPPPAAVFVFPDTYAESVDLSNMGSSIASGRGRHHAHDRQ